MYYVVAAADAFDANERARAHTQRECQWINEPTIFEIKPFRIDTISVYCIYCRSVIEMNTYGFCATHNHRQSIFSIHLIPKSWIKVYRSFVYFVDWNVRYNYVLHLKRSIVVIQWQCICVVVVVVVVAIAVADVVHILYLCKLKNDVCSLLSSRHILILLCACNKHLYNFNLEFQLLQLDNNNEDDGDNVTKATHNRPLTSATPNWKGNINIKVHIRNSKYCTFKWHVACHTFNQMKNLVKIKPEWIPDTGQQYTAHCTLHTCMSFKLIIVFESYLFNFSFWYSPFLAFALFVMSCAVSAHNWIHFCDFYIYVFLASSKLKWEGNCHLIHNNSNYNLNKKNRSVSVLFFAFQF